MNQRYTDLTLDERYPIKAYKKAGYSNREIAVERDLQTENLDVTELALNIGHRLLT